MYKEGEDRKAYISRRVKELEPWYHKIDLGDGIVTPGFDFDEQWVRTRAVMDTIDYKDKKVLDLASWDGYWAFRAEEKGASFVISSDARLEGYRNLLFCREVLGSDVIPMCNVPIQELPSRLSTIGFPEKFDVLHHLGLLYHLRDPMLSLTQARKVIADDGIMMLETAFIDDNENSYMAFNGVEGNFHFYGLSDMWAPTRLCLKEMLIRSLFEPVHEELWQVKPPCPAALAKGQPPVGRLVMLARPLPEDKATFVDLRKISGRQ